MKGAVSVNQVAKIEKMSGARGCVFNPRLTTDAMWAPMDLLHGPHDNDLDWHTTPSCLVEGLKFASRFVGRSIHGPHRDWIEHVHVANGKAYATDGLILVEYDVGESDAPYFVHDKKQIALIDSFGERPSEVATGVGTQYRWKNGSRLKLEPTNRHHDDFLREKFDEFDWTGLHTVSDEWRAQVVGQLSYKSGKEVFAHITKDRIVCGVDEDSALTQMNIETPIDGEASIYKDQFVVGIKLASKMKFEHQPNLTVMLITAKNLRAVVVGGRPQEPVPDLS